MINFSVEIPVPVSGWVKEITQPGKKCQHGVYIPSNLEDQTYAMHCYICNSLRAYIEKTGLDLDVIYEHQRFLWTQLRKDKKEQGAAVQTKPMPSMSLHAPEAEKFKRCEICDAQVIDGECEC